MRASYHKYHRPIVWRDVFGEEQNQKPSCSLNNYITSTPYPWSNAISNVSNKLVMQDLCRWNHVADGSRCLYWLKSSILRTVVYSYNAIGGYWIAYFVNSIWQNNSSKCMINIYPLYRKPFWSAVRRWHGLLYVLASLIYSLPWAILSIKHTLAYFGGILQLIS